MKQEGVDQSYIDLWREDLGYLMRPFIWIIPSHEKKTLFRLDPQNDLDKRLRTRWLLPGLMIRSRQPVIATGGDGQLGPRFRHTSGHFRLVSKVSARQRRQIDPFRLALAYVQAYIDLDTRDQEACWQVEDELRVRLDDFECPHVQWFHDKINDDEYASGRWVPFWACGDEFPADDMQELQEQIEEHGEGFAPDSGFRSFNERPTIDKDNDINNEDNNNSNNNDQDHDIK